MGGTDATTICPEDIELARNSSKSGKFWALPPTRQGADTVTEMAARSGGYEIHSEARGAHWVAWVTRGGAKPERSVVLVAETKEKAEEKAQDWAKQTSY